MDDLRPGIDEHKETWYPEPHFKHEFNDILINGTIRSTECKKVTLNKNAICNDCNKVQSLNSLRKRLKRRSEVETADKKCRRIDFLNRNELVEKSRECIKKKYSLEKQLFFSRSRVISLRVNTLQKKLNEYSNRGDIKAITWKLELAAKECKLADKDVLLDHLKTISKNFHVKGTQGKRYGGSLKDFYQALLILGRGGGGGGAKIVNFIALKQEGPEIHSVYSWRQKKKLDLENTPCAKNFDTLLQMYVDLMQMHNIHEKVPVLTAGVETSIKAEIKYCCQKTEELIGFCGKNGKEEDEHK